MVISIPLDRIHSKCFKTQVCQETESFKGTEHEGLDICEDGCVWFTTLCSKKTNK